MELSIDTASQLASIALSRDGSGIAENSWHCNRNHTVELLPAVDKLLKDAGVTKGDITAVFVCIGPGMYTGLRVGVTTAKALAHALSVPIVGIGRLELDAYPHRDFAGDVVAIHKAGRGELAWASYRDGREVSSPRLNKAEELANAVAGPALFVGEIDDALASLLRESSMTVDASEPVGRATALAALAHRRLSAGDTDEPALLAPIYLRPPAIGPQTPSE